MKQLRPCAISNINDAILPGLISRLNISTCIVYQQAAMPFRETFIDTFATPPTSIFYDASVGNVEIRKET